MLQVWRWISTGQIVYGYADKGLDCVTTENDDIGIMVLSLTGQTLCYCTQRELKQLASFQGYHKAN
jgi:hypothetical protein